MHIWNSLNNPIHLSVVHSRGVNRLWKMLSDRSATINSCKAFQARKFGQTPRLCCRGAPQTELPWNPIESQKWKKYTQKQNKSLSWKWAPAQVVGGVWNWRFVLARFFLMGLCNRSIGGYKTISWGKWQQGGFEVFSDWLLHWLDGKHWLIDIRHHINLRCSKS